MSILTKLLSPPTIRAAGPAPDNDFWYGTVVQSSVAGVMVTPETALNNSTVFRCVSAVAQDLAAMPLKVYRQLDDGGKEVARNHPLYDLLHDRPNLWQTSFEWREMMQIHLLLRGNGYNRIIPDLEGRGAVDQLLPLNPARMKVEQLASGRLRYTYTNQAGRPETYTQDEIFHLRAFSLDGLVGLSVVEQARNSVGLGLATEEYGARFFGQDARPGGVLETPKSLSRDAKERLREEWQQVHGGLRGSHKTAVLEDGLTWKSVGISNDDAQFLATRGFQVEEIARWFGVPLHRIGHTTGVTSWGTGIEQMSMGYVVFTLIPWLRRWEAAIKRDLIVAPQTYFAEFIVDHLLRGDAAARANYHRTAIVTGWETRNEVRAMENLNPLPGLDEPLVPQNMASLDDQGEVKPMNEGKDQPPVPQRSNTPPPTGRDRRAEVLAQEAAGRVVRKELAACTRAASRLGVGTADFEAWATEFYSEHADFVSQVLHLEPAQAGHYSQLQLANLLQNGVPDGDGGHSEQVEWLTNLALGG